MLPCVYVDDERNFGKFLGHIKRHKYGLIQSKAFRVKSFKVWRNKEALKMECNKRSRNYVMLFSEIRI